MTKFLLFISPRLSLPPLIPPPPLVKIFQIPNQCLSRTISTFVLSVPIASTYIHQLPQILNRSPGIVFLWNSNHVVQRGSSQHRQHFARDRSLVAVIHVAHGAHPVGSVAACGPEEDVDVASVDGHFREGAAQVAGDKVVVPVVIVETKEADAGQ